jgi:dienelactone hydrolase
VCPAYFTDGSYWRVLTVHIASLEVRKGSIAPFGMPSSNDAICAFLISSEDYAKDILAAVTYLAKDSSIDKTRIHVIGWSFGGGASFSALALAERESVKTT